MNSTPTVPPSRTDAVIEVLLVALLAFAPAAFGAVEPWSEAVAMSIGAAVAACLGIRLVARRSDAGRRRQPSAAWLAVGAFIAIAVLQLLPLPMSVLRVVSAPTAELKTRLLHDLPDAADVLARQPLSFYPPGTRQDLRTVLLATTVFAAVVTVYRRPRRVRRLLACVALIGGACAALALAQNLSGTTKIYWRVPMDVPARAGPFANYSHFAQFMNLSIGCALALLLARIAAATAPGERAGGRAATRWLGVGGLAAVIVLGLVTIPLSLTRGGTLAIVTAGGLTLIALLATAPLRRTAVVMIAIAALAGALLVYHGLGGLAARLAQPDAVSGRLQMARDALVMWRQFPRTGIGLGAFEWVYPMYDTARLNSTAAYVENEYVQVLVDAGPVGLAAVLAFAAVVLVRYIRALRMRGGDGGDDVGGRDALIGDVGGGVAGTSAMAAGLGYGLFAVMIHSLTDFGQHVTANACLTAVVCGLLFNLGERAGDGRPRAAGRGFGRPIRMIGLLVFGVVIGAGAVWAVRDAARAWRADAHWRRAIRHADALAARGWRGDDAAFAALLAAATDAIAAVPDDAYYRYRRAVYRWHWISNRRDPRTGDVVTSPQTVAAAQHVVGDLNDARARCATFGPAYTMLGQVEYLFLDRPIGHAHVQAGYRLSRNDADAAVQAALSDGRRGKWDSAAQKFREAVVLDPQATRDVIDAYLSELDRPELAADGVGPYYLGLIELRNALRGGPPGWKPLADAAEARAYDVLEAECQREGAAAWKFAMLAGYRADHGQTDAALRFVERALELEPDNLHWRVFYADRLAQVGRGAEAAVEARAALRAHPDAPEAQAAVKRLTGAPR